MEGFAEGYVTALKLKRKNEIFNITGREFLTVRQIVEYLKELIGNVRTEYAPPRLRDYRGCCAWFEGAWYLVVKRCCGYCL